MGDIKKNPKYLNIIFFNYIKIEVFKIGAIFYFFFIKNFGNAKRRKSDVELVKSIRIFNVKFIQ